MNEGRVPTWEEFGHHSIAELERLDTDIKELYKEHNKLALEMAVMKGKFLAYGTVGGAVMGGVISYIVKHLN